MNISDWVASRRWTLTDVTFNSLMLAAYRKATPEDQHYFEQVWPDIFKDFKERESSLYGMLPGEMYQSWQRHPDGTYTHITDGKRFNAQGQPITIDANKTNKG